MAHNAYSKDSFPYLRIDQIVDATTGHQFLSFLDAYSGYNKIPMFPLDSTNTTFITLMGMHCYNVMPFILKNVGASYQCMISRIFYPLLGRTIEAYIDDKMVKSISREDHMAQLQEAFQIVRLHRLQLNQEKCAFGVGYGNFLRFLVN